jgi:acyl carrier protein
MDRTIEEVKSVLVSTLQIEDRADSLDVSTPLFGFMPELDSMSVIEVVVVLEERFDIKIGDDEVTGEMFESVGSLVAFVDSKRAAR